MSPLPPDLWAEAVLMDHPTPARLRALADQLELDAALVTHDSEEIDAGLAPVELRGWSGPAASACSVVLGMLAAEAQRVREELDATAAQLRSDAHRLAELARSLELAGCPT